MPCRHTHPHAAVTPTLLFSTAALQHSMLSMSLCGLCRAAAPAFNTGSSDCNTGLPILDQAHGGKARIARIIRFALDCSQHLVPAVQVAVTSALAELQLPLAVKQEGAILAFLCRHTELMTWLCSNNGGRVAGCGAPLPRYSFRSTRQQ